ncbi:MAG: hypothetical protein ACK5B9_10515 [Flavobacteriia bacterium]|jgi:hypothetical protein
MKKITYIVFGLSLLAVTSCQKEVISPRTHGCFSDVEWKDGSDDKSQDEGIEKAANSSGGSVDTNTGAGDTSGDGSITDPNNDPDATKKKGKG